MNERITRCVLGILLCCAIPMLICCKTSPAIINQTQTEIATTGAEIAGDIATVKEITDVAKTTGEIPKSSVSTVIKYVDKASDDVTRLNKLIETQNKNIANYDSIIISLRSEVEKYKPYKWRFFIYIGLTVTGVGIVLIWKLRNLAMKIV